MGWFRNSVGLCTVVAAFSVALPCASAHGAEPPDDVGPSAGESPREEPARLADPWNTFSYVEPAPVLRLRIAAEELSLVSIGFVGYMVWNPPPSYPGVPMTTPWQKLSFAPGSWAFDNDEMATDFIGHPAAGTLYYTFARANRVSIPEAFLWAFGASALWELLEFKEPMSINDVVVTPVAGFAIGEAFTQLSGWFDHRDDTLSKILAWAFDPQRKFHDWVDGATPRRDPAYRGWHEFQLLLGGGVLAQAGAAYPALQLGATTRLFRAPGYGEAGHSSFGFTDGNVSAITLSATFTPTRVADVLFDAETAFAGFYTRDLERDGDGLRGWDLFVGATTAYEYGWHVWDLAGQGPTDPIAMVRLPGVDVRVRAFAGTVEVTGAVDVALDFAGVFPLGRPPAASLPPGVVFPTVYLAAGYYFALGLHVAPALELRWGPWAVGGSARTDLFWGFTAPFVPQAEGQVVSMRDGRTLASLWTRIRTAGARLECAVRADWRDRWGSVEGQRVNVQDRSLLASVAWVF